MSDISAPDPGVLIEAAVTLPLLSTVLLARVYEHPNKPYSAPILATKKRQVFVKAMGFYAAQRKGGHNGTPNWRFPPGWSK